MISCSTLHDLQCLCHKSIARSQEHIPILVRFSRTDCGKAGTKIHVMRGTAFQGC